MAEISTIVDVQIDRQTKIPSRVGFGVPLILDQNTVQSVGAVDTFVNLQAMIDFGFSTSDEAYKAAAAMFSQNPKPPEIRVSKREADVAKSEKISIDTVANNELYTVTLNGVDYDYTSSGAATDIEIRDALIALIDAVSEFDAVLDGSNTFDVSGANAGFDFSVVLSANMSSTTNTEAVNVKTEILRTQQVESDWYALFLTTTDKQEILDAAETVETLIKVFGALTDEADTKDLSDNSDTTSLGALLKANSYDRTFLAWTKTSKLGDYLHAAWAGAVLPKDPGSVTWKFKNLAGVTADDDLTGTEIKNLDDKNVNYYQTVAGVPIINSEAKVASGEYIDIIRGTDKLQRRIQENVFTLLINEDKVAYTNKGGDALKTQIEAALQEMVDDGLLRGGDDAPVVTVPDVNSIPVADRAARIFGDIEFEAIYAGAVHKVRVRGTISI